MNLNYIAPLSNTGYSVASKNILISLSKHGIKSALFPIGAVAPPDTQEELSYIQHAINNSQFFDYNAPCVKIWHQFAMGEFVGRGEHVGFPIFELDKFSPHEIHHLHYPCRLFVCSEWAKQVVHKNIGNKLVDVVPLGIDPTIFYARQQNTGTYTFVNIGKWEVRKGHDILVDMFNAAFTTQDDVRLILMPHNPFLQHSEIEGWHKKYKDTPMGEHITIMPYVRHHKEVAAVIAQSDCGIFPSRAEGWNLELLETMAMGKPVITTNYSSHTEYCTDDNSYLISIDETELAQDGKWFFGQGNWAKLGSSQIEQGIQYMRHVYKNRPYNTNGVETGLKYTWQESARAIINHLNLRT